MKLFWHFTKCKKAPEALAWLTYIQECRGKAPGSYRCQNGKGNSAHTHNGKRRRTYRRLSDFRRFSVILMIFWAIPWFQKGAGSYQWIQRCLWVCRMTQYMYVIVWDTTDHLNIMHTWKAPSVFRNVRFSWFWSQKRVKKQCLPQLQRRREAPSAVTGPYKARRGSEMFQGLRRIFSHVHILSRSKKRLT